jgi:hypothetical protein
MGECGLNARCRGMFIKGFRPMKERIHLLIQGTGGITLTCKRKAQKWHATNNSAFLLAVVALASLSIFKHASR